MNLNRYSNRKANSNITINITTEVKKDITKMAHMIMTTGVSSSTKTPGITTTLCKQSAGVYNM